MVDVLVAHHNWRTGGETAFNVSLVQALCRLGYQVAVASVAPIQGWPRRALEEAGCVSTTHSYLPFHLDTGYMMQRLLLHRSALKLASRERPGLVWIDTDLYKPLLGRGLRIVEYLHFPYEVLDPRYRAQLPPEERIVVEEYLARYRRGLPRIYMKVYTILSRRLRRPIPFPGEVSPIANSGYIAGLVEAIHGVRPHVLYPPVEPLEAPRSGSREEIVVSIGRFSPEKRYEVLIEAAGMAQSRPRVVLIGSTARHSRGYIERLRATASRLGVDLAIVENPSRRVIGEVAGSAMAYVHTAIGEHFGITVVEAMSLGLPVIVHKSGGPWIDIVERGRYGLGFTGPEDLAEGLDKLLWDPELWSRLHGASLERYKEFTLDAFTRNLSRLMAKLA